MSQINKWEKEFLFCMLIVQGCRYLKQLRTKHSKKLKLFSVLTVKICKVALLLAKTTSHFLFPCLAVNLETKSKTTSK